MNAQWPKRGSKTPLWETEAVATTSLFRIDEDDDRRKPIALAVGGKCSVQMVRIRQIQGTRKAGAGPNQIRAVITAIKFNDQ